MAKQKISQEEIDKQAAMASFDKKRAAYSADASSKRNQRPAPEKVSGWQRMLNVLGNGSKK